MRQPRLSWLLVAYMVTLPRCAIMCAKINEVGEYTLTSINGQPLPFRIYDAGNIRQEIVRGSLSLNETGHVLFTTEFDNTLAGISGPQHDTATGTYQLVAGNIQIRIKTPQENMFMIQYKDDKLLMMLDSLHIIYTKRK